MTEAPRRLVIRLLRGPAPAREARHLTTRTFVQWNLTSRADDAALAVSEIATNALVHGHRPVLLVLRRDDTAHARAVTCSVINRGGWRTRDVIDDEHGRGLLIARQAADAMTVRSNKLRTIVMARFTTTPAERA